MIGSILVVSALALQGAPAAKTAPKPAAPIAVVADAGPTVEVPADLAALTGQDTIAVIYLPDASQVDKVNARVKEAMGPVGQAMPIDNSVAQFLKQSIRTDLEIPMNQPMLWWIDMPATEGDEPPMGMAEFVFRQAVRIPGAEAAMAKAKADAANAADPKAKPALPIRARARRSSVSVLPGDVVVISSDMEPFRVSDKPSPSTLLKGLPVAAACGRVDLSRIMAEQGDQLRMLGGLASMGVLGGMDDGGAEDKLTDAEKRQRVMKRQLADAVGKQVDDAIDALLQLKRATFAASIQGDDFVVWADWSREAAFPKGLSANAVQALAGALPSGMTAYFGASTSAIGVLYGDRVKIDDALATLGATPEQAKAYEQAMVHARQALDLIEDGAVGGFVGLESQPVGVVAFKVKDAAAFRKAVRTSLDEVVRSGLAQVKVTEDGGQLSAVITPDAVRVQDIMGFFAPELEDAEAVKAATVPTTLAMRFKGNEVLVTQGRGETPIDPATLARAEAADIRGGLAAKAWGTADWFGVADLRPIFTQAMSGTTAALNKTQVAGDPAGREQAVQAVAKGKPMLLRLWQGVQGGTARLTVEVNLADWKQLVEDVEKARKAMVGDPVDTPAEPATDDPT
jgi:hypothetical protein